MVVYALFALFFISLYYADRRAAKDGLGRWSGDWAGLIPGRGISWAYMGGYLLAMMAADPYYQVLSGVFGLFGFFYVFTALYRAAAVFAQKRHSPGYPGAADRSAGGFILFYRGRHAAFGLHDPAFCRAGGIATTPVKIPPVRS